MTLRDGRFVSDNAEEILDAMVADAQEYFGEDLNDTSLAIVRTFYRPIAQRLAEAQDDIGLVLDSSQIDHATGGALDLLCALIGITRDPATKATGEASFERSSPADTDYIVPVGTVAQTDSLDPERFETTAERTIEGPATETDTSVHSTSETTYVTVRSFTVDVTYRESVDVAAELRTTNSSYTAYIEINDGTNNVQITTGSTTSTTFVSAGPVAYDVSGLTGDVTFDYRIKTGNKSGTAEMQNAEAAKGGESGTLAPIKAVEAGADGNVGTNAISVLPDPPTGVESVTNPAATVGGTEEETDEELRERTTTEITSGSRASASALIGAVSSLDGVTSNSIFINDTGLDNTGSGGLPDHSFELVISGGNDQEIGQTILDTKAAGDTAYGGANGTGVTVTADLPNGQTHDVSFSRPAEVQIYVDVNLVKTSLYAGNGAVKDAIVEYIGGLLTTGNEAEGLGVGEDVIYTEIMGRIQQVAGVYDVSTLEIGTSASPTGTSNIAIAYSDVAIADGTDSSMNIATSNK